MEYFNRILLRTGQSAIVWYRFIQKVFHSKKPFNMHSCANRTLSIIYTCNMIFRIDERFTQFLKVLALKFRDTQCWTGIHRTPSVCWPNDSLNTLSDNIYQMFYHFYIFFLILKLNVSNSIFFSNYRARISWIRRSCRSEWNYFQQTFCRGNFFVISNCFIISFFKCTFFRFEETRFSWGSQHLHLLSHIGWWW